jgi:membrane protease YdiL (CAAX protease family)
VTPNVSKPALVFEFLALFVALPLAFGVLGFFFPPLPALWIVFAYCYWLLRRDASFDRSLLWNPSALQRFAPTIVVTFAAAAAVIAFCVWRLAPAKLFVFVRTNPIFWAVIMCLYPVLSVYPQSLIYRAFFFHRYQSIFPSVGALTLASALAFSFTHIVFRNPIAPALTFFGGLLFAYRFRRSGSLLVSAFEHALYGCFMFTVGLGMYFYHGATLRR